MKPKIFEKRMGWEIGLANWLEEMDGKITILSSSMSQTEFVIIYENKTT